MGAGRRRPARRRSPAAEAERRPTQDSADAQDVAVTDPRTGRPTPTAFGTVGLPITAVAVLGLLAGLVLLIRSKRAQAAGARRQAAQAAQGV